MKGHGASSTSSQWLYAVHLQGRGGNISSHGPPCESEAGLSRDRHGATCEETLGRVIPGAKPQPLHHWVGSGQISDFSVMAIHFVPQRSAASRGRPLRPGLPVAGTLSALWVGAVLTGSTPVARSWRSRSQGPEQGHPVVTSRPGSGKQLRNDQAPNRKATGQAAFLGHESGREGA